VQKYYQDAAGSNLGAPEKSALHAPLLHLA